jgi:diguanylate cyclase (GGDEF)-like protein
MSAVLPAHNAAGTEDERLARILGRLLPALIEKQAALLSVKDAATGRYEHVNEAMAAVFGVTPEQMVGRTDTELVDATVATMLRAADQTALAQSAALASEHRFELRGRRHDFSVLRMVAGPDAAGARQLCSVWMDQAPQRQKEAQLRATLEQLEREQRANEQLRRELQDQSLRDPATGLYKRTHFDDQLRREVDLSTREHREFAVVSVALDPLPEHVAAMGEPARARILEALGRLLRGNTRAMDASCRYGDNRFAVLLSGVGLATAHSRMEGLRRQCATHIVMHDGQELGFSVSMGVASYPHTAHGQDDLLQSCEGALAEAQRRGGNQVTLASIRFDAAS